MYDFEILVYYSLISLIFPLEMGDNKCIIMSSSFRSLLVQTNSACACMTLVSAKSVNTSILVYFATYWPHKLSNDLCSHTQCSLRTLIYHSVGWEIAELGHIMESSRLMHLVTRKLSCPAPLVAKLTQDIPHIHQRNKWFYVHCSAVTSSPCSSLCFGPAPDFFRTHPCRDFTYLGGTHLPYCKRSEGNQKK